MQTLKDVLPEEAFGSEYIGDKFQEFENVEVVETQKIWDLKYKPWPGTHKNVMNWYILANDKAVGFNESPSRGWAFPVITYKGAK